MADTEEYFPRGGKKPTTTYFKQSANFLGAPEKGEKKKKKPKKKSEGDDGYLSDEGTKEIDQSFKNCAFGLSYKTVKEGLLVLGRVKNLCETKVIVSLPCRLIGSVMACHISEPYNKELEAYVNDKTEKVLELSQMFRPGQYIAVKVLEVKELSLMLSVMPQHVNAQTTIKDLQKGNLIQAAVASVEDHGYVMDIGVPNTTAQNSFPGITWHQLKDLFLARFVYVETPAATLCRLFNESPKDGECMSAYASRFLSTLMNQWHSLSTEQIAIAVTLAHAVKIEPRLQRLAYTEVIDTRVKLQQELMACTYRKRGPPMPEKSNTYSDAKKPRYEPKKCYNCGKLGHMANECLSKGSRNSSTNIKPQFSANKQQDTQDSSVPNKTSSPTCYYCNQAGHIATRCPKKDTKTSSDNVEHRVNACTVKPATDHLAIESDED